MIKKKCLAIVASAVLIVNCGFINSNTFAAINYERINSKEIVEKVSANELKESDMPQYLRESIEWVYNNRMVKEGSVNLKNLIFDQIIAGRGTLNYVVRWQSTKSITLEERKAMEVMIYKQINNWAKYLKNYDGWPYDEIEVKIVGWACADESLILDKQSDEIIYTDYIVDELSYSDSNIPTKLPVAPSSLSRAEHYYDNGYAYPGGLDKRFDMYLWATSNFQGGAGGDWGQRMSDDYLLATINDDECHILEHEIGHGYGLPDFYNDEDRPPSGFPVNTIMWAGDSMSITEWDAWMLRYTWSQLKKDTERFNISEDSNVDDDKYSKDNLAVNSKATTSYCSDWENISALNDGYEPLNSNDRNHAVYGNWPRTGKQWVQYDFETEKTIKSCDIYWFKDNAGIDVPSSYTIKYWNGKKWTKVKDASGLGTEIDQFNTTTFQSVTTSKIRIEMNSNNNYSTGILEWKVYEE